MKKMRKSLLSVLGFAVSAVAALGAVWTVGGDTVGTVEASADSNSRVLLIQDTYPWGTDSNAVLLNSLVNKGYIEDWAQTTTSAIYNNMVNLANRFPVKRTND